VRAFRGWAKNPLSVAPTSRGEAKGFDCRVLQQAKHSNLTRSANCRDGV
jgi:hypothetical protein